MPAPSQPPDPAPTPSRGRGRSLRRFLGRDSRDHLWSFLDFLDARPARKKLLLIGIPILALAAGLGVWGYERWARTNAIRIARQWLQAGRLDRASDAVRDALAAEPGLPDSWRVASELAWREGNKATAVDYAKKAAAVSRYQNEEVLAWAEAAILSDDLPGAQEALACLDPAAVARSARALRLKGEIARRQLRFGDARDDFRGALELDTKAGVPSVAIDEVPLGISDLQEPGDAGRADGQAILTKWAPDPDWGAAALRALLNDAVVHREAGPATRLAETLRAHPRCTLGDIPTCLQALQRFGPEHYEAALTALEKSSGANPTAASQLLGWLNQIGQPAEAARWGATLDPAMARKPPVAQGIAEALRATGRWADLQDWTAHVDWGAEVAFLGYAYGLAAARGRGDAPAADTALRNLESDGRRSPAHALFAGDSLYAWGFPDESARLLWLASERPDLALTALGTLARLYQMRRDAVGEYRAFSRLAEVLPADRGVANNYAYFAAVTDLGSQTRVKQIAADNFDHEPENIYYRSTYAFVLAWSGQGAEAMKVIEPVARDWAKSPAIAFAYGAALTAVGRAPEARPVFESLNPRTLSPQEIGWIRTALRK